MRKMFSQKQIKNIVNEGIESGEVNAQTKIYKHVIDVFIGDTMQGTITMFTNTSDPIESLPQLEELFISFPFAHYVSEAYTQGPICYIGYDSDQETIEMKYLDGDEGLSVVSSIDRVAGLVYPL